MLRRVRDRRSVTSGAHDGEFSPMPEQARHHSPAPKESGLTTGWKGSTENGPLCSVAVEPPACRGADLPRVRAGTTAAGKAATSRPPQSTTPETTNNLVLSAEVRASHGTPRSPRGA